MSSLAVPSHGIPIPPEESHSARRSAAIPGFTGTLQIELLVSAAAIEHVRIRVIRRQSRSLTEVTREEVPAVGEHVRKKSVQRAVDDIRGKLLLRTVLLALEAHYVDGELKKWTIVE